ncbi:MAG: hypothetical protein KF892_03430 [Rhizobacter sp.]|nr:hypothetical protein [Rhizobacter sp.]
MKQLRLWLVVLLVALLPVRGAMAAAMLCAKTGASGQAIELRVATAEHAHHGDHHDDHHGDHHANHHAAAQVQHGHHGEASQDAAGHDNKCTMCSAFCSATPLPSAVPQLPEPGTAGTTQFADLHAPAPIFQSGGPERPPRSI